MLIPMLTLLLAAADPGTPAPEGKKRSGTFSNLDKVECRFLEVTGSRAQTRKMCMTRREWNRGGDRTRDELNSALSRAHGPDR